MEKDEKIDILARMLAMENVYIVERLQWISDEYVSFNMSIEEFVRFKRGHVLADLFVQLSDDSVDIFYPDGFAIMSVKIPAGSKEKLEELIEEHRNEYDGEESYGE